MNIKGKEYQNKGISKDAINKFGSSSRISSQNENESLRVYSLIIKCSSIGTRRLAGL